MYIWNVEILFNNGAKTLGLHKSECSGSADAAKELIEGDANTFNSLLDEEENRQIFFKIGDVSALSIGVNR